MWRWSHGGFHLHFPDWSYWTSFSYTFVLCTLTLWNFLFKSPVCFLIIFELENSSFIRLYLLSPYQIRGLPTFFPHYIGCFFTLIPCCSWVQYLLSWVHFNIVPFVLVFVTCSLVSFSKILLLASMLWGSCPPPPHTHTISFRSATVY